MIVPIIPRKTYTLESFKSIMAKFSSSSSPWFNVLSPDVIDWYASRLSFPGDLLMPMISIALDDPFPIASLNYGIIDCLYSAGQIIHCDPAKEVLAGTSLSKLILPLTSQFNYWSMREFLALDTALADRNIEQEDKALALDEYSKAITLAKGTGKSTDNILRREVEECAKTDFLNKYGRSDKAFSAKRNFKEGPHSGWCVSVNTPEVTISEIPDLEVLKPFRLVKPVADFAAELNYINSLVSLDFSSIILGLPTSGDVNVVETMLRLGADKGQMDCIGLPWELHQLLKETPLHRNGEFQNATYLARECIILASIAGDSSKVALYTEVVLKDAPTRFTRKAINAVNKISTLSAVTWAMGPAMRQPLFAKTEDYVDIVPIGKVPARKVPDDPDATTYTQVESPARPGPVKLKGFDDMSTPRPHKMPDPFSVGSLRAGFNDEGTETGCYSPSPEPIAAIAANTPLCGSDAAFNVLSLAGADAADRLDKIEENNKLLNAKLDSILDIIKSLQ